MEWRDVAYGATSERQRLDIYLPRNAPGRFPAVVWLHGGAWRMGSRALAAAAYQKRVLERGIALVSVGYRLSTEAQFPAQIHDVKAAVRFLRAHADTYRLATERIAAWGSSAGGHLAALLGTSGGDAALEGDVGVGGSDSRVQAVVDWFGPTSFLEMDADARAAGCTRSNHAAATSPESQLLGAAIDSVPERARSASPLTYIAAGSPPFLVQHGERDCVVAYPQSTRLRDALRAAGVPVELTLFAGEGHDGPAFSQPSNLERVLDFLQQHLVHERV